MKNDMMKLIAQEMIDRADDKEIKCLQSYILGFAKGLEKAFETMTMTVLKEAKKRKLNVPDELKDLADQIIDDK